MEEQGALQTNKLLLFLIAPYIPATDRVRLLSVCRLWREVLRQDDVWQRDYEHVILKMPCLACIFKEEKERGNQRWYAFCMRLWPPAITANEHFIRLEHPSIVIASIVAWYEECRKHLLIHLINLLPVSATILCKNTITGKEERFVHRFDSVSMIVKVYKDNRVFRSRASQFVFMPEFWQPYRNLVLLDHPSYIEKFIRHSKKRHKKEEEDNTIKKGNYK